MDVTFFDSLHKTDHNICKIQVCLELSTFLAYKMCLLFLGLKSI